MTDSHSASPALRAAKAVLVCLFLAVVAAPGGTGEPAAAATLESPTGAADPAVVPLRLEAEIRGAPDEIRLAVSVRLTFRAERDLGEVELLLAPEMDVEAVSDVDGNALPWSREPGAIRVAEAGLEAGARTTWRFDYALPLGMPLRDLEGYYAVAPWYPYALRTPATDQEFPRYLPLQATVSVTLPSLWAAVSVGRLSVTEGPDRRTHRWSLTRPAPVIPLVIDRLQQVRYRGEDVEVLGFFHDRNIPQADIFVEYVGSAVEFYSARIAPYGRPTYTLVEIDLPPGVRGVTLRGLTALSSRDIDVASPFPYRILAHEVAHNWWSHAVEFPRRTDGWLREGLPTYSALMFIERRYGTAMMREELERSRRIALAPETAEPLDRGFAMQDSDLVYPLNYHKSAFVLHMLRRLMGLQRFTSFLRSVQGAHGELPAHGEEVRRLAEQAYGDDLSWFFRSWVEQAAIPSFRVRYSWEREETTSVPAYRLTGTVEQVGARVEGPAQIRVRLTGAPPLEHTIWLEPGTTRIDLPLPSRPELVLFDPAGDLLYRDVEVEERHGGAG